MKVSDAVAGSWVEDAPDRWRPYLRMMRADRPIGWWLLLLPCWQGVALAAGATGWSWWDLWLFPAFLIGAVAMRGAGCCLNDILDRDIDARVARTRSRPIPSGAVSVRDAALFMGALCFVGLVVLLTLGRTAIWLGFASVVLVAIYPLMKRVTDWPQLFLGLAFNWGALVGWAAHAGGLALAPIALYAGGILWTIGYDTIYAHQDREDDALVGVRSTARLFGSRTPEMLAWFYGGAVALAMAAGALAGLGIGFWVGVFAYAGHLIWQIWRLDVDDPDRCLALFRANRDAGLILLAAIVLGTLG